MPPNSWTHSVTHRDLTVKSELCVSKGNCAADRRAAHLPRSAVSCLLPPEKIKRKSEDSCMWMSYNKILLRSENEGSIWIYPSKGSEEEADDSLISDHHTVHLLLSSPSTACPLIPPAVWVRLQRVPPAFPLSTAEGCKQGKDPLFAGAKAILIVAYNYFFS